MKPHPDTLVRFRQEQRWTDSLLPGAIPRGEGERARCSECGETLTMAEIIESHCISCSENARRLRS